MTTAVFQHIEKIKKLGSLQDDDLANIVHASPASISRWASGLESPPLHTQKILANLRYVVDRLSDFYNPNEVRVWLHAKHPLLNNSLVIDLIYSNRTEEVLEVIERLNAAPYI